MPPPTLTVAVALALTLTLPTLVCRGSARGGAAAVVLGALAVVLGGGAVWLTGGAFLYCTASRGYGACEYSVV